MVLKTAQYDHHIALQERSVLRPKHVAGLEPLLPPRVTDLWQRMLLRAPRMKVQMGARISDRVCSRPSQIFPKALRRSHALTLTPLVSWNNAYKLCCVGTHTPCFYAALIHPL